jgi:ubiquinone/menaquinone biosynthesis C-methylase UbiE
VIFISGHRFFIEEDVRRQWYDPEQILKNAGLREGMVFADVGCGDGFFAILAARVVGYKGRVYAVDVNSSSIQTLQDNAVKNGIFNLEANAARAEDTVFCVGCVDIVFYSIVLHDFEDPTKVLQNAMQMLKPSGKVIDLDWKKEAMPFGPPVDIRFSESTAKDLMQSVGLRVTSVSDVGKYHYLMVAEG